MRPTRSFLAKVLQNWRSMCASSVFQNAAIRLLTTTRPRGIAPEGGVNGQPFLHFRFFASQQMGENAGLLPLTRFFFPCQPWLPAGGFASPSAGELGLSQTSHPC